MWPPRWLRSRIRAGASDLVLSQACLVVMADTLIPHLQRYFNSRSGIVTVIKIKEVVDQLEKAAAPPSVSRAAWTESAARRALRRALRLTLKV